MSAARGGRFWLVTVAALVGFAATAALGFWQLGRANDKLALQAAMDSRHALPAIDARAMLLAPPADVVNREIVLRGTWMPRYTVWLENRQIARGVGFFVVTPLKLEGSGTPVLVERGWAPRNFMDRTKLPAVDTPEGIVEVHGRVSPPPAKLYEFGGTPAGTIRQNLDLEHFRGETGLALPELAVQQSGGPSEGLLREWPQPASGVERHYGYMFQWWAIALVIAFLYAWFQFIAPRRKARAS